MFVHTDEQMLQMSQFHAGKHSHQLVDQSTAFDNSLLEDTYTSLPNDVHLPYIGYSMPSSSSTTLNGQTSSWIPDQLMREEGTGMLSSIPGVSVNASEITHPKMV